MLKRMIELLTLIKPLMDKIQDLFGTIPIDEILAIIKRLLEVTPPPAIKDEKALREWLTTLATIAEEIAEATPVSIDDTAADFLVRMIGNDNVWGFFYMILSSLADGTDPDHIIVQSQVDAVGELREFSPAMLIMIAEVVMKLIEMFRNR